MSSPDSTAKPVAQTMPRGAPLSWLTFDRFLLIVALLIVFVTAAIMGTQSDTWWVLRTGELILRTGNIPTTDVYSSTVRGGYWPNHEWLAEVLFYACYALGGLPLLFLACAGLTTAAWYGLARLGEGPGWARAVALLLGIASQELLWSVRPHLFSLALLVLLLALLPARRLHWLYPLLFLLWANLHAGVAFGGVALAIVFLVAAARDALGWYKGRIDTHRSFADDDGRRTIDDANIVDRPSSIVFDSFRDSVHWLLVLLASGLATLVNPLGVGLWIYILTSFGDQTRSYLSEWQPPSLSWPASYPFCPSWACAGSRRLVAQNLGRPARLDLAGAGAGVWAAGPALDPAHRVFRDCCGAAADTAVSRLGAAPAARHRPSRRPRADDCGAGVWWGTADRPAVG
jgi:hypothetical protein